MRIIRTARDKVEPLHLLDCCMESDGAVALVVTNLDHARHLRQPPAVIRYAASGFSRDQLSMSSFYREEMASLPEMQFIGQQLWRATGLEPRDMDLAIMYDHFTPSVLFQLEALGFCGSEEAPGFVNDSTFELRW